MSLTGSGGSVCQGSVRQFSLFIYFTLFSGALMIYLHSESIPGWMLWWAICLAPTCPPPQLLTMVPVRLKLRCVCMFDNYPFNVDSLCTLPLFSPVYLFTCFFIYPFISIFQPLIYQSIYTYPSISQPSICSIYFIYVNLNLNSQPWETGRGMKNERWRHDPISSRFSRSTSLLRWEQTRQALHSPHPSLPSPFPSLLAPSQFPSPPALPRPATPRHRRWGTQKDP